MSTTPVEKTAPRSDAAVATSRRAYAATKSLLPSDHFVALASRVLALRTEPSQAKCIGLTSCLRYEGNTTVASHLAVALAAACSGQVLLVTMPDLSLKVRKQRAAYRGPGWCELMAGEVEPEDVVHPTKALRLSQMYAGDVLSLGPMVTDSQRIAAVIKQLKQDFEFVVVDLPHANELTGCFPMAAPLDGVLLVVQQDGVKIARAVAARQQLEIYGAHLVGVVMNKTRSYVPRLIYRLFPFLHRN